MFENNTNFLTPENIIIGLLIFIILLLIFNNNTNKEPFNKTTQSIFNYDPIIQPLQYSQTRLNNIFTNLEKIEKSFKTLSSKSKENLELYKTNVNKICDEITNNINNLNMPIDYLNYTINPLLINKNVKKPSQLLTNILQNNKLIKKNNSTLVSNIKKKLNSNLLKIKNITLRELTIYHKLKGNHQKYINDLTKWVLQQTGSKPKLTPALLASDQYKGYIEQSGSSSKPELTQALKVTGTGSVVIE